MITTTSHGTRRPTLLLHPQLSKRSNSSRIQIHPYYFDFIVDTGATDIAVPEQMIRQMDFVATLRQSGKPIIIVTLEKHFFGPTVFFSENIRVFTQPHIFSILMQLVMQFLGFWILDNCTFLI